MSKHFEPAFATLRAFVAAARHESMRMAADELGVTPSAISHQIKLLEEHVGHALFARAPRQVRLTPTGRKLLTRVSKGFDIIAKAVADARGSVTDTSLRVSALPLFTNVWLIPRLERFDDLCTKLGTKVSIEIETSSELADFETHVVDVAIRNVRRPSPSLINRKLLDLNAVPLCSSSVAGKLSGASDLARATLIHISARRQGWQRWFQEIGIEAVTPRSNLTFDTIPGALEAAAAGRGVMLGIDPLVWVAPAASDLVIPFPTKRVSAGTYFVTYRKSDRARRPVKLFADWLVAEMMADRRRLAQRSSEAIQALARRTK